MPYAIFRYEKLKTCGQIAGSAGHAQRTRNTPNADANQQNIWLIGNPNQDLVATVRERIGKQTIRKKAIYPPKISSAIFFSTNRILLFF